MKKIALVVQRCGKEIVGGSESYALQLALLLSDYQVDIITTTAADAGTWRNDLPAGEERVTDFCRILRFPVDFERQHHWFELNRIVFNNIFVDKFSGLQPAAKEEYLKRLKALPLGIQQEWMRRQGPYSTVLLEYLGKQQSGYDHFLFMTYLYPTTFFGFDRIGDKKKVFIIPTLHDEPPAYLTALRKYAQCKLLFLTQAEMNLARRIMECDLDAELLGYGLADKAAQISKTPRTEKYVLYAGRLEPAKGVDVLYEFFTKLAAKHPELYLYTIGDGQLKDYKHKNIKYMGFVSEGEKLAYMQGALALIHPSAYESLGIVLLEAFMMNTPALVNKKCEVLDEHIRISGGGFSYDTYEDFEKQIETILRDEKIRSGMGGKARNYFLEHYSYAGMQERVKRILSS